MWMHMGEAPSRKSWASNSFIVDGKGVTLTAAGERLQAYLGHRSIQSTVRYTELAPGRFKNIWR
jgi:hypothetical protein